MRVQYIERWSIYSIIIGIVVGIGTFIFYSLLQLTKAFFLGYFAGFHPVSPAGEHPLFSFPSTPFRLWVLVLIPAIGGLIVGFIVYSLDPEVEGDGTDAVIDAFHNKGGEIKGRVPIIKAIASAITIGSGGSAGREGPIMQIGGGIASFLASHIKLGERERREMMICGAAAGLGAIFKAPLGGAIFAMEVLYRRDFEIEAMIPATISSVVSYAVFSSFPNIGWRPIFETHEYNFNPYELIFYALLGIASAIFGIFYVRIFYGTRNLFRYLRIPRHIKPAIGGAIVGCIAFLIGYFLPKEKVLDGVLGMGYGVVQLTIYEQLPLFVLLLIAILKIFSTSFTVGSGGSGGLFAPSLVIGAMFGGFFGGIFHLFFPTIITQPSAFALVGMAAFFGGIANVPLASMIMVTEMTGSYSLLAPLMISTAIAYALTWRWSIYEKQVRTRIESPAHRKDFSES
ncbi:MAG: chloride channel protein [Thermoprotei archaeon]